MKAALLVLFLAAGIGERVAAQTPWRSSYFPYPMANPSDGPTLVLRWQRTRNAPYFVTRTDSVDVINPITFSGAFSAEAGIGTRGSRFGRVELRAPGLVAGWRFRGMVAAERQGRFGYYGFGGDIERAETAANPNDPFFRVHRSRFLGQVDITRTIAGPLRLALGGFLDRTELDRMPDTSLFRTEHGAGLSRTSLIVRPALVLDTRDREFTPSKGVLLEVGGGFGTGAEKTATSDGGLYGFGYAHLRGFVSPREGTVVAGRVLARTMGDRGPFPARFTVPGWEKEFSLSGADGHRSFPLGALAATDASLVSLEIRHDLLAAGDLGAVTLVGFTDFAHLADDGARFRRSTDQWGGGAGVALRILRSAILSVNFAGGSNGFAFSMGTGWAF